MSFFFSQGEDNEPVQKKRHMEQNQGEFRQCRFLGVNGKKEDSDEDEDERPVLNRAGGDRIGLKLLQDMQQPPSNSPSFSPYNSAFPSTTRNKMHVVEEYVPLSKGGFMESGSELVADDMEHVRPGNVMCLRCPAPTTSPAGDAIRFVKETDLTEEERRYGKRVLSDMVKELFEVGRVDRAAGILEAVFLDGTRQKLKIYDVRPAGFVETELFQQWKRDPSSQPVRTVYATSNKAGTEMTVSSADEKKKDVDAAAPTPWWVTPHLIVRVVEKLAGDLFGKKFVVKSILRKEKKIRLAPWHPTTPGRVGLSENSLVDVVGCEALETIVPKINEEGIIVLGKMRGELVKVIERRRGADGELMSVKVCSTLTGNEFTVGPHEVCQLVPLQGITTMLDDAGSGTQRVDVLAHFQSHHGIRTTGYRKNKSQVVFNMDGVNKDIPSKQRRERGPGREFGRFVELFGFPEKRPQSSSQKRIYAVNSQSNSINLFQHQGEASLRQELCDDVSLSGARLTKAKEAIGSHVIHKSKPSLPDTQQSAAPRDEATTPPVLHDDEEIISEKNARIQLLEEALAHEKRQLRDLLEKRGTASTHVRPTDVRSQRHWNIADESSFSVGVTNISHENVSHESLPEPLSRQRGKEEEEEKENFYVGYPFKGTTRRNEHNYNITSNITRKPPLLDSDEVNAVNGSGTGKVHINDRPPSSTTRGRNSKNWTLAEHYAGWR